MNITIRNVVEWLVYMSGMLLIPMAKKLASFNKIYQNKRLNRRLKKCGKRLNVNLPMTFCHEEFMEIGDGFASASGLYLECIVKYGKNEFSPKLVIGNNVWINRDCHIGCMNKIVIGDNVMLGERVLIEDHAHGNDSNPDIPVGNRPLYSKGPIIIGDNVWIGNNVCIFSNVNIGQCSIIGANSVVNCDIPAYSVAVGAPARVVKSLKVH